MKRNEKMNEKIRTPFIKKTNSWIFDALMDFFWNFYGKLDIVKVSYVHQEPIVFWVKF